MSSGVLAALVCISVLLVVAAVVIACVCYYRRKYSRLKGKDSGFLLDLFKSLKGFKEIIQHHKSKKLLLWVL